jgi:hypothetical protein
MDENKKVWASKEGGQVAYAQRLLFTPMAFPAMV